MQQSNQLAQPYDNTLKALFGNEAAEILPRLLPHTEYLTDTNIEIDRTMLKADLVYKILYKGQEHLLNMELQTGPDDTMEMRLLMYHAALHWKEKLPVISVILYPFKMAIPEPPFREMGADGELLTLHYQVLALWTFDARHFVREQVVGLYTLLPAMQGASVELLKQALKAMKQHYSRVQLSQHLIRFRLIMRRSKTMSPQEKAEIEEELKMEYAYDFFIDENPDVIERVDRKAREARIEGRTEGRIEGRTEGEMIASRKLALNYIQRRFPALILLAQQRFAPISQVELLDALLDQLFGADDEEEARKLLEV